ncbi:MAG: hypothetical protein WC089_02250 [Candidatus Paceibacterota bacterium]
MKDLFKILKILVPALVLTLGLNTFATYTSRPASFSSASNTAMPLMGGTYSPQYKTSKLALGTSSAPIANFHVEGSMVVNGNAASFGSLNLGSANCTPSGCNFSPGTGKVSVDRLVLENIDISGGKPGPKRLCASSSGELTVCSSFSGVWYRNTPGHHTFDTAILPPGVKDIKVELWGAGGNSVPRTDSNPGNAGNKTNPGDSSSLRIYSGSTPTFYTIQAEAGKMGYGTTTWGTTMQTGGEGGKGYVNGIEQATAKGGNGQNPFVVTPSIFSASGGYSTNSACVGGSGGTSATSTFAISGGNMTVGGYGGAGGARTGTTNGRGLSPNTISWGAGGGGFGRESTLASALFCTTKILVGGEFVTPMSGGGGAGAHVVNTYRWEDLPINAKFEIDIGEGGINNHDWMTGNGANGGVLITW